MGLDGSLKTFYDQVPAYQSLLKCCCFSTRHLYCAWTSLSSGPGQCLGCVDSWLSLELLPHPLPFYVPLLLLDLTLIIISPGSWLHLAADCPSAANSSSTFSPHSRTQHIIVSLPLKFYLLKIIIHSSRAGIMSVSAHVCQIPQHPALVLSPMPELSKSSVTPQSKMSTHHDAVSKCFQCKCPYSKIAEDQIRLLIDEPYSDLLLPGFGLGAMRIS